MRLYLGFRRKQLPLRGRYRGWLGSVFFGVGMYYVEGFDGFVKIEKTVRGNQEVWWTAYIRDVRPWADLCSVGRENMVKYIRAAERAAEGREMASGADDKWLFDKRPALREYMTSFLGAGDAVRETSVLMISVNAEGFRVGLKDEDAGGWLWRECETVAKGLDSIEKALADGSARFRTSKGQARPAKR